MNVWRAYQRGGCSCPDTTLQTANCTFFSGTTFGKNLTNRRAAVTMTYRSKRRISEVMFSPHAIVWGAGRYHTRGYGFFAGCHAARIRPEDIRRPANRPWRRRFRPASFRASPSQRKRSRWRGFVTLLADGTGVVREGSITP
jgi:hypothetical protein